MIIMKADDPNPERVECDQVYSFMIEALRGGLSAEALRNEVEAAIRFADHMRERGGWTS
jgi:hypothetical protein